MEKQLLVTLSRNKLLKNVNISNIDLANIKGQLITVTEGEILFREGDIAEIIYLVISGEINILKKRLLGKTKSYIFSENDFFGHEEFFEETSRTSTAVALRDSYIIALTREEVEYLIKQDDEILINLREPVVELDESVLANETKLAKQEEEPKWAPSEEKFIPVDEAKHKFESPDEIQDIESEELEEPLPPIIGDQIFDLHRTIIDEEPLPDFKKTDHHKIAAEEISVLEKKDIEISQKQTAEIPPAEDQKTNLHDKIINEVPFFDEASALNEDGIPKAEFELPEIPTPPLNEKKIDEDFNDILFQILHRTTQVQTEKKIEPVSKPIEDEELLSILLPKEEHQKQNFGEDTFTPVEEDQPKVIEDFVPTEETEKVPAIFEQPKEIEKEKPFEPAKEQFKENELTKFEEKLEQKIKIRDTIVRQPGAEESIGNDELQMIIHAAELVNSNIRIDEVLKNIVDVATEITNADRGTLYLLDSEKDELWSLIAMGEEMREIRLKLGEGLAGFSAKSGEIINIQDVQQDPRWNKESDRASGYKTRNMICFPIRNKKREVIGVLQLLNSRNGKFSKHDEQLLNAISINSAIALHNAELVEKLLRSERIQSLGKMVNFLIQDIKKPILVGKRYAEHLKSKKLPQDTAQIVDMLLDQITQIADLVQTTSSYSEGKAILRTMNTSLNNTLSDYYTRFERFVEERKSRIINEFDKDVTVKLDMKEFFQCYAHILKNACEAMPDGGNIIVSTKRNNDNVTIFIKDTGLGIHEGFIDKIFEPFISRGKKEGTGLGLSIVKKIIEAHNGSIKVESTLGKGTTFIITLPLASTY